MPVSVGSFLRGGAEVLGKTSGVKGRRLALEFGDAGSNTENLGGLDGVRISCW